MKREIFVLIKKIAAIVLFLAVCVLASCRNDYRCRIINTEIKSEILDAPKSPYTEIIINGKDYMLSWMKAESNDTTGGIIDDYRVINAKESDAYIKIDRKSGDILSFYGITPYDALESITQEAVRAFLGQHIMADTNFEEFTEVLDRKSVSGHTIFLFEMPRYNAYIEVELDENGIICRVSKNIAIPESKLYISAYDEIAQIEKALKKEKILKNGMSMEITSKKYSLYKGESAISYIVSLEDEQGFHIGVYIAVITE